MLQISNIRVRPGHEACDLNHKIKKILGCEPDEMQIIKRSLDARKKDDIHYLYSVAVRVPDEGKRLRRRQDKNVTEYKPPVFTLPEPGSEELSSRPVIVGAGPAGLLCALTLARAGYRPLLLEQGAPVEERLTDVEGFWAGKPLKPWSNVQFGEGGAGTFSDGKLMTRVKDKEGLIRQVLSCFVDAGAPAEILYEAKPHLGTDTLAPMVRNLREEIIRHGGEVLFHERLIDIRHAEGALTKIISENTNTGQKSERDCRVLVLAPGHSATKTFELLKQYGAAMTPKSFAVGLRIQHPQSQVDEIQYGAENRERLGLPAADYQLTAQTKDGRGVFSFCMCPGGQVVNASSEEGHLAVNGMSYSSRDGRNANSALVVSVTPDDFGYEPGGEVLAGVYWQRALERSFFACAGGAVPVQLWGDFEKGVASRELGEVMPDIRGRWQLSELRSLLPEALGRALCEAMPQFERRMKGFYRPDAVLAGIESRTSSPVRVERDAFGESSLKGLYPCGEGAGYAGGITSAAADGIRIARFIIRRYCPQGILACESSRMPV